MAERTAERSARKHDRRPPAGLAIGRPAWASERRLYGDREQASMPPRTTIIREVVAVTQDREALEGAIHDLQSNGFDRSQISLLATRNVVERLEPAADTSGAPGRSGGDVPTAAPAAIAGIAAATSEATGGALAGIGLTALPVGNGGDALRGTLAKLLPAQVAHLFQEQIDRGGVLVWVSLPHPEREATAREILGRHAGEVRVYDRPCSRGPLSAGAQPSS